MRTHEEIKTNGEQTVGGKSPLRPLKIVRMSDVEAAEPPIFMRTSNTPPLPSTMKLTAIEWRVIVTHGEHTRFGKACASITFVSGVLGYARRNKFQTDYIQIVCPTTKGSIGSWYIHETEAEILLTVARPAPNQNAAQRGWDAGWMQSF